MKYFLIIRHGRPDENYALCPGDPPLDPQGMEHAVSLAEKLVNEGIDRIVSSPQRRAIDTATPLSKLLDLEIEIFEEPYLLLLKYNHLCYYLSMVHI